MPKLKKCALCENFVDGSREHIIPSSLGGRKTVNDFICSNCNHRTGTTWDAELHEQLKPLCTFFNIKLDRKNVSKLETTTVTGNKILLSPKGTIKPVNPILKKEITADGLKVQVAADNKEELLKVLNGISRNHTIDIEQILQDIKWESSFSDDPVKLNLRFEGLELGKSAIKSCLSLAHSAGIDVAQCDRAIDFLRTNGKPCYWFYYASDVVINRPRGSPMHCVIVQANKVEKNVVAYIEYFGFRRLVAVLSSNYSGDSAQATYAIDPVQGKEVEIDVELEFDSSMIINGYSYGDQNIEYESMLVNSVMGRHMAEFRKRENENVIKDAVDKVSMNFGIKDAESIPEGKYKEYADSLINELEPYIHRLITQKKRP